MPTPGAPIPSFSRKYRTTCSTCHTAAPKLNVLGEAFRLKGYRFPENDALLRRDEPVPLGEEPWKDLWPRAIWPGELPGAAPIALRLQNDLQLTRDQESAYRWTFRFPHEVYLLAAATLGEGLAAFFELEWSRELGTDLVQAKLEFQDLVPGLPPRALNLWVGLQNLYLFTFADRQIDRAARQPFLWQQFRMAELELRNPVTGQTLRSSNEFQLRRTQPALELNGLAGGRLYYGVGLAQGGSSRSTDNNNHKDVYWKLRYKLAGLRLDGTYPPGSGPVLGGRGQLMDRSLTLEHFGYLGAEPVGDAQDDYRAYGVSLRWLYGPLDLGVGYVRARHQRPWGTPQAGDVRYSSLFAKGEHLLLPWVLASLKWEHLVPRAVASRQGFTEGGAAQTRVLPGLVLLIRQNVRGVVEAELFAADPPLLLPGGKRPHNLWFRLDVAF